MELQQFSKSSKGAFMEPRLYEGCKRGCVGVGREPSRSPGSMKAAKGVGWEWDWSLLGAQALCRPQKELVWSEKGAF